MNNYEYVFGAIAAAIVILAAMPYIKAGNVLLIVSFPGFVLELLSMCLAALRAASEVGHASLGHSIWNFLDAQFSLLIFIWPNALPTSVFLGTLVGIRMSKRGGEIQNVSSPRLAALIVVSVMISYALTASVIRANSALQVNYSTPFNASMGA